MTDPTSPLSSTPPPELSRGARTALRSLVVVAAAVLLLCGLGGLTAAAVGIGNTRVIADSQTLPESMRTLTISTGAVPMRVQIESDDEARETYPDGWESPRPYIRIVPQPE